MCLEEQEIKLTMKPKNLLTSSTRGQCCQSPSSLNKQPATAGWPSQSTQFRATQHPSSGLPRIPSLLMPLQDHQSICQDFSASVPSSLPGMKGEKGSTMSVSAGAQSSESDAKYHTALWGAPRVAPKQSIQEWSDHTVGKKILGWLKPLETDHRRPWREGEVGWGQGGADCSVVPICQPVLYLPPLSSLLTHNLNWQSALAIGCPFQSTVFLLPRSVKQYSLVSRVF